MIDTTMRQPGRRQILVERRHEMQDDVQSRIRHGRTDRPNDVRDDLEVPTPTSRETSSSLCSS